MSTSDINISDGDGSGDSSLSDYDPSAYPPFAVTVDVVVFTIVDDVLQVVLVRRGEPPFKDRWALPGGFVREDEAPREAARRELAEETKLGLKPDKLEQLRTYSTPGRDPRQRVVTVAFWAILPALGSVHGGTDARTADFVPVEELEADIAAAGPGGHLAFDHDRIATDAIERARSKLEYTTFAARFCPHEFTMTDLRLVYEAVWGTELEPANFRRKVEGIEGFVRASGRSTRDLTPETPRYWSDSDARESWSVQMLAHRSQAPPAILEAPMLGAAPRDFAPAALQKGSPDSSGRRRGRPASLYVWDGSEDLFPPFRRPGT